MSLPDIIFRTVPPKDISIVMRLEHSMPHSTLWEPATVEDQMRIINSGNMFGMYTNDVLIGKVGFWQSPDDGWEVDGLIIDAPFRNRSYGSQLFTYAMERISKKEHPTSYVLYTHPHNIAAIILYLKAGFIVTGFHTNKYGPGKDRLRMIKLS